MPKKVNWVRGILDRMSDIVIGSVSSDSSGQGPLRSAEEWYSMVTEAISQYAGMMDLKLAL